jgi:hypothetical protein
MEPTPMPKTRLLIADREAIRDAIIDHKFTPLQEALAVEEAALADEARRIAYGPYLRTVEKAPEGAFGLRSDVRVNVGGKRIQLAFAPDYSATRRVFSAHRNEDILAVPDGDAFGARVLDYAERKEVARKQRGDLYRSTFATLAAFRTFEDLLVAWPEAASFVRPRLESRPEYEANVPAVVLADLTAALDLPPEDVAQAA